MPFAIFRCCPTAIFLKQYETATDAVLKKLGIEFVDVKEFNCCGYPLKNIDFKSFVMSSARNLSLAESRGSNIVTLCSCCYGSLKQAQQVLQEDRSLKRETNTILKKEGLQYNGNVEIKHLLELLCSDVGSAQIQKRLVRTYSGLKVAAQYGCHMLRPKEIMHVENSAAPPDFDRLVEVTGAESVDWSMKLECCGSPMWGVYDDLSMDLTESKIKAAKRSGADYLCVACVYCQLQFDRVQQMMITRRGGDNQLPSILFPQLLGLVLGIDEGTLGLNLNKLDLYGVLNYFS
jgi:heterodisulfide reductase subunit B